MKKEKEISSWARALYLAFEEHPDKLGQIMSNLNKSLIKKQALISGIAKKFEKMYKKEKNAELILAMKMEEGDKKKIKEKIQESMPQMQTMHESIDGNLLAGFRVKTKDVLVKASLRDILQKLKNKTYGHN
ncbi:MAG: F0F1 ATP synthase subunit delta [Candidatus Pacebacteria bacterium]|nr:F0F1 ATP synthase subunit delta [Candidatus Paceibacterota bacterium]